MEDTVPKSFAEYLEREIEPAPVSEDGPDTLPSIPRASLLPPRMPSDVAPYVVPQARYEIALVLYVAAACLSALYLGFELEHHWQIGGFPGVAWFLSVVAAAGMCGGTVAVIRGLHRGE
jgi:hypothetical protein